MRDTIQGFREYQTLGVRYIVLMDPEDRTTFVFTNPLRDPRLCRGGSRSLTDPEVWFPTAPYGWSWATQCRRPPGLRFGPGRWA